ncbi:MAG: hypothetical protein PHT91_02115 [Candidatus Nanoarchaeia archaeon]|nr:hypothetical protein [Candidatus Nanoarchaeia archaeon]MDD5499649.1 hypothetical protein [Candidatus Nanoarchaeia archaeon]
MKNFFDIYYKEHKKLFLIPFILLIFNISVLIYSYATTGNFVEMDSTLKGGVTLTFHYDLSINIEGLKEHLINGAETDDIDISIIRNMLSNEMIGYEVVTEQGIAKELLVELIEEYINDELFEDDISFGSQSSVIGQNFAKEAGWLFFIGALLMLGVSYAYFRDIIPALSIVVSTLADVIGVLAVFNLFSIKISVITIGALLMIMGYSTDSDILLSTNILKKKDGTLKDRMIGAFKTELTMNATALITFIIMLLLSSVEAIKQISMVLIVGMFFDLLNTWLMNASIQRTYLEYKESIKK